MHEFALFVILVICFDICFAVESDSYLLELCDYSLVAITLIRLQFIFTFFYL